MAATAEATAVVTVTAVTVAEAAAVVTKVAVARAAVALLNVTTETTNALVPETVIINVLVVLGLMVDIVLMVATLLQEDAMMMMMTMAPVVEAQVEAQVKVHLNVLMENTNAKVIPHTNAKVVLGSMKNTARVVAMIRLENAIQNVQAESIVAHTMFHKGAAAENG